MQLADDRAWRTDDPDNGLPPLPIRWYVEHCRMNEYLHPNRDADYNGDSDPGIRLQSTENLTLASAIALEEAGADYDLAVMDTKAGDQRKPEYLALNPNGRKPCKRCCQR